MEESFVIQTNGLSKSFGSIQALKSLDLRVRKNSIFAFLGPNGAGKTTAIKLLLGLAKPTAGSASVFGFDIRQDSVEIRRRTGYLPQDPRFYDHMTARQTLSFVARFFYSGPKAEIHTRIDETLELVGLSTKADRPIKGFSGGERQRLGIAQAQINYPDLLILDEPAASLDPQGRHDVLEVMERLRKHTTIFYSTHILADVQRVSDTVAILNHGQLIAQAPIDDLLASRGSLVYSLMLKGDVHAIQERLIWQPWVASVRVDTLNGRSSWQVSVQDEAAAEEHLLPLVQSSGAVVLEFGRKKADLEEVFLGLTEGGTDVK
jgi:ABC-2 type transport system ATP-binding protein